MKINNQTINSVKVLLPDKKGSDGKKSSTDKRNIYWLPSTTLNDSLTTTVIITNHWMLWDLNYQRLAPLGAEIAKLCRFSEADLSGPMQFNYGTGLRGENVKPHPALNDVMPSSGTFVQLSRTSFEMIYSTEGSSYAKFTGAVGYERIEWNKDTLAYKIVQPVNEYTGSSEIPTVSVDFSYAMGLFDMDLTLYAYSCESAKTEKLLIVNENMERACGILMPCTI